MSATTSTAGALVLQTNAPYRTVAQKNWNLTDEQMRGMHVHHRIPRSKGGTNDPTNLYVCSPSFHAYVWHRSNWVEAAAKGGRKNKGRVQTEAAKEATRQAKLGSKPKWEGKYPSMARNFTPEYREKLRQAAKRRKRK